jgi:hydrogenase nickel incorporation protein HypA/HybF
MHEFGIAKSLVDNVKTEAVKNQATEVSEVILEIGELTFIGIDQLKFAYATLTKEIKILANSRLEIKQIPAEVSCKTCGYKGPLRNYDGASTHIITPMFACPSCGGKIDILKGRECTITNIKMMVDDDVQVS